MTDEGKKIMRSIRQYGKGKRGELKYIYKHIQKRERYIADMEGLLLRKEYLENKMYSMVTMLGEHNVPITVRTMKVLVNKLKSF